MSSVSEKIRAAYIMLFLAVSMIHKRIMRMRGNICYGKSIQGLESEGMR